MPIRPFACAALSLVLACSLVCSRSWAASKQESEVDAVVLHVSPSGSDSAQGDAAHPFRTLERAHQAVREANSVHSVTVRLATGIYRLTQPLIFSAADGGRNCHHVDWTAEPGAVPVISGAIAVSGWKVFDRGRHIYVADVPVGLDSRQLWIDDQLAKRAAIEIPRSAVQFSAEGLTISATTAADTGETPAGAATRAQTAALPANLDRLPDQKRIEVEGTGWFTDRFSPVERIVGRTLRMQMPAWKNNTWGYDTLNNPYGPEAARLFLANSLQFLTQPGQWYLDPARGKLYVRPPDGAVMEQLRVELPRISTLIAIGDNLDSPVENLGFHDIRFSHTTWLGPSSNIGYASQQSGAYLATLLPEYPPDALTSCKWGCPIFEHARNEWHQTPAAIQVAAAKHITFDHNVFAHLGQYALGVGNDANANITGVGLGTAGVFVTRNVFADLAGGAIQAGGVRRAAHHPRDPRQLNTQLFVINNRIRAVSKDYRDNSAVLSTYVEGATILHNEVSDVPYDAIDIGYGWGIQDAHGNPNYRLWFRGYDFEANLVYETPTTHRDVYVGYNRIHGAKQYFHDGGAIYNLSASPGTVIAENYIFDNDGRIGLYLDEGSRYITVRNNVVADPKGTWLNANTISNAMPLRVTLDNTATGNWHDGTQVQTICFATADAAEGRAAFKEKRPPVFRKV
ncbi:MAG TPA: hypothetical protein VNO35_13590 [Steroidobacteraceae bacterium]|nr:hypothetical protein [Steroidobacteraceae bacterium]